MILVENVSKRYGHTVALALTSLTFAPQTTTVLIGPSGCGKSTLLRIIVGLISPDSGTVRFDDEVLTAANIDHARHRMGYVIQDGGLFPHLTAAQNVRLLPEYLGKPSAETAQRIADLAELLQLPSYLLARFPSDLSGGQRQRIGLMRALMLDPEVLLLDEPLGALDPITRNELQSELRELFRRLKKTVIMVTHDMGEAQYLGDRIVLMRSGTVVQSGSFDDLVRRPLEPYVSEFMRAQRALPADAETGVK